MSNKRKHISWKTKCAATLAQLEYLRRPGLNYEEVKTLGQKRFLKRWHFDHNILHETGHPDRDEFWNLTPMHVKNHVEKTKRDAAIIAKGRRIREREEEFIREARRGRVLLELLPREPPDNRSRRKLRSRGFDKRFRRKMDGTVVKR